MLMESTWQKKFTRLTRFLPPPNRRSSNPHENPLKRGSSAGKKQDEWIQTNITNNKISLKT